jgi:hypothetical protein
MLGRPLKAVEDGVLRVPEGDVLTRREAPG